MAAQPPQTVRGATKHNITYTGQMGRLRHQWFCSAPHPFAYVSCTCPASADLSTNTPLRELSSSQYNLLYEPVPLPLDKYERMMRRLAQKFPDAEEYAPWRATRPSSLTPSPQLPASPPTPAPAPPDSAVLPDKFWEQPAVQNQYRPAPPPYPTYPPLQPSVPIDPMTGIPLPPPPGSPNYPPPQFNEPVYPSQPNVPILSADEKVCRAPVILELPGVPYPCTVECQLETYPHPGLPHVAQIPSRQRGMDIRVAWILPGEQS